MWTGKKTQQVVRQQSMPAKGSVNTPLLSMEEGVLFSDTLGMPQGSRGSSVSGGRWGPYSFLF